MTLAFGSNAVAGSGASGTDTITVLNSETTTSQSAVFAAFLSSIGDSDVNTAISVSNVLKSPAGSLGDFFDQFGDTTGVVQFFLCDRDGTPMWYETGPGSPGLGLLPNGQLGPGQTYTVLLSEILAEITGQPVDQSEFVGYGWVVGNFDAIAGTYNVTIFGVGFTQNFELLPGMAQGGYFGGVDVFAPNP